MLRVLPRFSIGHKWVPIAAGLVAMAFMAWAELTDLPLVRQAMQRLEYLAYDLRLNKTLGSNPVDRRVVIVDIDEKSLREEGHWPWARDRIGLLVDRLYDAGAAVIGFDVMFVEPERNAAASVLRRADALGLGDAALERMLSENLAAFDNNVRFAQSLEGREVVLGYVMDYRDDVPVGALPVPLPLEDPELGRRASLIEATTYTGNIPILQEASQWGGFFSLLPDQDGVIRRAPLLHRYHGEVYGSLALEMIRVFLLAEQVRLHTALVGELEALEAVELGGIRIPTDGLGRSIVPYRGPRGSYPYLAASDVLAGRADPELLAGALVLVGSTAQGLFDLRTAPVQAVYPGVEVHANLISAILDEHIPTEPAWASGANLITLATVGTALALLLPFLSSLAMVLTTAGVFGALVGVNFWFWSEHGLVLALAPPLLLVLMVATVNIAIGFWQEARSRRQLKGMFGQYVPPELVEEMNRNPGGNYGFDGESREMTVLFCDIRSFTTISESLSASGLKELLNTFFTPMTRLIFDHRGTIDKYVGDMIMAFWGAPLHDPKHAEHAVATALAMLEQTERLKPEFKERGFPEVNIGIGLNTGVMNVGDMGSEFRRSYTVLGDAVNLGSRLEGTTKSYGVGLVIGETTREQAGDAFVYRELDLVRVKGKAQAIRVFQPVCRRDAVDDTLRVELAMHEQALERYRKRDWDGAEALFSELGAQRPDVYLYRMYLERIAELRRADPGEDWDGAFTRTTK